MEAVPVKIVPRDFGETRRRDWWWVEPMIVFAVFGSFVVYATWAAFQNAHYTYGPYLSPFYSPEIWGDSHHDLVFLCGDRGGELCPAEGPSSAQGATERQQLFRFESGLSQSPRWGRGWRA